MDAKNEYCSNVDSNNNNVNENKTNTINVNESKLNTINENNNIQEQIYYLVLVNVFITLTIYQMNAFDTSFSFKITISDGFGYEVIYTVSFKNFNFNFNEDCFCMIFNNYSISSVNELNYNSFTFELIFCDEYTFTIIYTIFTIFNNNDNLLIENNSS